MDPGTTCAAALPQLGPLITGGSSLLFAIVAGGLTAGMGVTSLRARRRLRRWAEIGSALGMPLARSASASQPTLRGVCRDRAVESLLLADGRVQVTVRVANPLHFLDRLSPRELASAHPSWLTATGGAALTALSNRKAGNWQVVIDGNTLTLTVAGSSLEEKSIQSLIYLACELAVGVDSHSIGQSAAVSSSRRQPA